jgi:hypothetical protein
MALSLQLLGQGAGFRIVGSPDEVKTIGPVFEADTFRFGMRVATTATDDQLDVARIPAQVLVDTGSDVDCINDNLAIQLRFAVVGTEIHAGRLHSRYDAAISLPDGRLYTNPLGLMGFNTSPHSFILGREFLFNMKFLSNIGGGFYEVA